MQISTPQYLPLKPFTLNLYDERMIRQIRGKVLSVGLTSAVVEVAGFGIEVRMSSPQTLAAGSEASLATHLAVRQDGMDLYGFPHAEDRDLFELILSLSFFCPNT